MTWIVLLSDRRTRSDPPRCFPADWYTLAAKGACSSRMWATSQTDAPVAHARKPSTAGAAPSSGTESVAEPVSAVAVWLNWSPSSTLPKPRSVTVRTVPPSESSWREVEMVSACRPSNRIAKTASLGHGTDRFRAIAYSDARGSYVTVTLEASHWCDSVQTGLGENSQAQRGDGAVNRNRRNLRMGFDVAVEACVTSSKRSSSAVQPAALSRARTCELDPEGPSPWTGCG